MYLKSLKANLIDWFECVSAQDGPPEAMFAAGTAGKSTLASYSDVDNRCALRCGQ